jgi:hypothetical protein
MLDLAAIKNELDKTYDDPRIDDKVAGILARAEAHIRKICAVPAGADLEPTEEQIVIDCCRYIDNNAFEDFDNNFMGVINGCRSAREAAAFAPAPEPEPEPGTDPEGGGNNGD